MADKTLLSRRKSEYRAVHRDRYRRSTFIAEYTQRKFKSVYEEANSFYEQLVKQYPNKSKLSTCLEYKVWEKTLQKDDESPTSADFTPPATSVDRTPSPINLSSQPAMELNISLMNSNDIQEIQHTVMFEHIYPSLLEEIEPETLEQIVNEIRGSEDIQVMDSSQMQDIPTMMKEINYETVEQIVDEIERSDYNIFNDEDINSMIEEEINNSLYQLDPLEKELLKY